MSTYPENIGAWPPAPTHAPEMFTIERLSFMKTDALAVYNPVFKRSTILTMVFQVTILFGCWVNSVRIWLGFHNQFGPHIPVWNDPFFRQEITASTLVYFVMMLFFLLFSWTSYVFYQNKGTTIFRPSGIAEVGRRSGHVESIEFRQDKIFGRTTYNVVVNIEKDGKSVWKQLYPAFRLREQENANRCVELLAEFLDVPLTHSA